MDDQELTSGLQDFFGNEEDSTSGNSRAIGSVGTWLLHLVVFAFAVYSGYHGISATMSYHGDGLGTIAGVVGILVIEAVLIGIYLAYFNRRITGDGQKIVAAATLALGFTLSCLGIIGDSQLQAGMEMSGWLSAYLVWGLPIAPALMALGAAVVMAADPGHLRKMKEAVRDDQFAGTKHEKRMAAKEANLKVAQQLANMQLNGKMDAARYVLAAYRTPEVQDYIRRSALANMPDMMRSIGVDLPYGTVVEGHVIEPSPLAAEPPAAENPATPEESAGWLASLRNRMSRKTAEEPVAPDAPPADNAAVIAAIQDMLQRGELAVPLSNSTHATHDAPRQPAADRAANGPAAKPLAGQGDSRSQDFT